MSGNADGCHLERPSVGETENEKLPEWKNVALRGGRCAYSCTRPGDVIYFGESHQAGDQCGDSLCKQRVAATGGVTGEVLFETSRGSYFLTSDAVIALLERRLYPLYPGGLAWPLKVTIGDPLEISGVIDRSVGAKVNGVLVRSGRVLPDQPDPNDLIGWIDRRRQQRSPFAIMDSYLKSRQPPQTLNTLFLLR